MSLQKFGACLLTFRSIFFPQSIGNLTPVIGSCFSLASLTQSFVRNYKTEERLRRRCRDCFFERRDNRLYVECKTHARHRQAQIMSEPRTPWKFRRKIWKHLTAAYVTVVDRILLWKSKLLGILVIAALPTQDLLRSM
ncbi:hypothetical protein ACTXT7_009074 [Hymenolepis weldensis]